MKVQYEEWKRQNKDQDVSQKDFRSAMINSRAFEYTSIKDEQQKKEFWVNVVATVAIVGVSIFCPPAGLALGLAYGGLEMSAAVSGKDWLTGRELDTSERVMRGAFSLLDIVPGMKAFSGGTQAIRSGTKLASLSDNLLHGVKSIPSKADDLIKLGKSKALTRINSLKTTVKEGIHTGVERTTKGLDKVGEVADNFKNNLNLNSRRQLATNGFGALPAGGTSKVTNATEKMKDVLRKYDLNLSSGRHGADDIVNESSANVVFKSQPKHYQLPDDVQSVLKNHELTVEEFNKINVKREKTQQEINMLKDIRKEIPIPTKISDMRKVIPVEYVDGIIKNPNYSNVGGFVTEKKYVKDISKVNDVIDSSRLDYTGSLFKKNGNYAYIDFTTDDIEKLTTPFSTDFGGTKTSEWPFAGSGFTASENGTVVPEWEVSDSKGLTPNIGSTIHEVINGKDTLVAIYDYDPINNIQGWVSLK
ncbi:hypothetical protein [Listeria aquatica]|uniref:hypothetical protein n=1 Tax=Listeria aquatica TaxID=1494960 RepID=UPI0031F54442